MNSIACSTPAICVEGFAPVDLAVFQWELSSDQWWWSTGTYLVHGYQPGAVEPTFLRLLDHQHPEDRDRTEEAFVRVRRDGRPFVFEHRLITTAMQTRTVILSAGARRGRAGRPSVVTGTLLDVSESRRLHHAAGENSIGGLQAEIFRLSSSAQSRDVISQATGVLMERHKVTAAEAAQMLRSASQIVGRKLPDIASDLLYTGKLPPGIPTRPRRPKPRPGAVAARSCDLPGQAACWRSTETA